MLDFYIGVFIGYVICAVVTHIRDVHRAKREAQNKVAI